jgi:toxin FitB
VIVLDTNVVSEAMRAKPRQGVLMWLDSLDPTETSITTITASELLLGAVRLPEGHRRDSLEQTIWRLIDVDFHDRVEPFDVAAAYEYAQVVASRQRLGRPISSADAQIASICRSHGAVLATRNTKDFDDVDIEVINPWEL